MKIKKESFHISKHINEYLLTNNYDSLRNYSILDIGCGNGYYTFGLSNYCKSIIGIDPSEHMIKDAKIFMNKKYNNVTFINEKGCNIYNNMLHYYKFNIILFSFSLHYCDNTLSTLQYWKSKLKGPKIIILFEPNFLFDKTSTLHPDHKDFDLKTYNMKISKVKKCREQIYEYLKNHKHHVFYKESNSKYFKLYIKFFE